MTGRFITFEGIDGSGKSTQAMRLVERLRSLGREVTAVREPGSSPLAERVRAILLDPVMAGIDPRAELLLYVACRADLVEQAIRPALSRGATVVSDRFSDSTVAYQGYGRRLGAELVRRANLVATSGLSPDLTFLLDVPVETGASRTSRKRVDRLEGEDTAFHERVRHGFLEIARQEAKRIVVVDGAQTVDEVTDRITDQLRLRMPELFTGEG